MARIGFNELKRFVKRFVICHKQGLDLRANTTDKLVFDQIFFDKIYGFEVDFTPLNIVDAGANVGFASIYFALRFPGATILAIEPEPTNYAALCKNVSKFKNIIPIQAALGGEDGVVNITDVGLGEHGFVTSSQSTLNCSVVDQLSMTTLLDRYKIAFVDILKIDIEGSEKEVFEAENIEWVQRIRCLAIELHDRMKAGCSIALFRAMTKYPDFNLDPYGEGLVFIRTNAPSAS
jgi:FkbM family methyltransferase